MNFKDYPPNQSWIL